MPLTPPDAQAEEHSGRLAAMIRARIDAAGGAITFAQFMQLALYAPGFGYYSAGSVKLGAGGDFVTAPELGTLFGRCLATQCVEILEQSGGNIVEFGAGSAALAVAVLEQLERIQALPDHYAILEISPDLKARQQSRLSQCSAEITKRLQWIEALPDSFDGVVIANEVLDAFPVSRFKVGAGVPQEEHAVKIDNGFGGKFIETHQVQWLARVERLIAQHQLPHGYVSELGLQAQAWVASVGERLGTGAVLLVDYGYPAHEYYHAQRTDGTLRCHYRHQAHNDAYILVGLQDITAHVEFSALARAAEKVGLTPLGFTQQSAFLMSLGLTDVAVQLAADAPQEAIRLANEIKMLTLPQEMGESFKVFAAGRGVSPNLQGFKLRNHLRRL